MLPPADSYPPPPNLPPQVGEEFKGMTTAGEEIGNMTAVGGGNWWGIFSDSTPIFIGVSAPERQRVIGVMRGTEERI